MYINQQQKALEGLKVILEYRGWSMVGSYVNTYTKIIFKCDKGHEVLTRPNYIKKGGGCSICSGLNSDQAKEKFISLVNELGYEMIYPPTYINNNTSVQLKCTNGHLFEIRPHNMKHDHVCSICIKNHKQKLSLAFKNKQILERKKKREDAKKKTLKARLKLREKNKEMVRKDRENSFRLKVENASYIFIGKYVRSMDKVEVMCNVGHKYFVKHSHFKMGKRCPICNNNAGFNPKKPAILYYLRICSGSAYKIGITNRTVIKRFEASDLEKIEVLKIVRYENGYDARAEETRILREFKYAQYQGVSLLSSGNTELFDRDVLGLDDGGEII